MTRQLLNRGTTANDGTGDTLRQAGLKIEQNFTEIYLKLGGDSATLMPQISFDSSSIIFEGTSVDDYETRLLVTNPTADRNVYIPDHSGILISDSDTQTLTNKTIVSPILVSNLGDSDASFKIKDIDSSHTYDLIPAGLSASTNINLPALTDSDEFTFNDATQTLNNKTLNAPLLNNPKIGTEIQDSSGNQYIEFESVAGSINHIKITSTANGVDPIIGASGGDTNIDLGLEGKGDGAVSIKSRLQMETQNLTSAGGASLDLPMTMINSTSAIAVTVADGTTNKRGEVKHLVNINSGTATVTFGTNSLEGGNKTSISMPTYSAVTLVWAVNTWVILNNTGATAS